MLFSNSHNLLTVLWLCACGLTFAAEVCSDNSFLEESSTSSVSLLQKRFDLETSTDESSEDAKRMALEQAQQVVASISKLRNLSLLQDRVNVINSERDTATNSADKQMAAAARSLLDSNKQAAFLQELAKTMSSDTAYNLQSDQATSEQQRRSKVEAQLSSERIEQWRQDSGVVETFRNPAIRAMLSASDALSNKDTELYEDDPELRSQMDRAFAAFGNERKKVPIKPELVKVFSHPAVERILNPRMSLEEQMDEYEREPEVRKQIAQAIKEYDHNFYPVGNGRIGPGSALTGNPLAEPFSAVATFGRRGRFYTGI